MIFRERELQPYDEPVQEDSLVVGAVYFAVQFCDPDLIVPTVQPVVFIGRDLFSDETGTYFQDAESYLAGIRQDTAETTDVSIYRQQVGQINHIYEYEHALDVLLSCSLRRDLRKVEP